MPGVVLDIGHVIVVNTGTIPALIKLTFHWRKKTISRNRNVPEKYQLEKSTLEKLSNAS